MDTKLHDPDDPCKPDVGAPRVPPIELAIARAHERALRTVVRDAVRAGTATDEMCEAHALAVLAAYPDDELEVTSARAELAAIEQRRRARTASRRTPIARAALRWVRRVPRAPRGTRRQRTATKATDPPPADDGAPAPAPSGAHDDGVGDIHATGSVASVRRCSRGQ